MENFKILLLLVLGIILIIKGGDMFVDAASWMGEKTGIPKVIIGATIVSLATTLPEMLVSFIAASEGKVDMAIGNAVGSVSANTGLAMGITLICLPSVIKRSEYIIKSLLMIGSALIIVIFGLTGSITIFPNILLLIIFVIAMIDNIVQANNTMKPENNRVISSQSVKEENYKLSMTIPYNRVSDSIETSSIASYPEKSISFPTKDIVINISKFIIGALFIITGSQLLVDNGSTLATILGIPERIIAITVIAIGTSLPELVTTISSISKKENCICLGNIIGANIIDLSLILPISSLISGKALPVSSQLAMIDLPMCLILSSLALIPTLITKKFNRWQGITLLLIYFSYLLISTLTVT